MKKKLAATEIYITVILMGGRRVAKERKEIESVTESGTEFEITFTFLIIKNVTKLQIILMYSSFKAEKKCKKARKEKRRIHGIQLSLCQLKRRGGTASVVEVLLTKLSQWFNWTAAGSDQKSKLPGTKKVEQSKKGELIKTSWAKEKKFFWAMKNKLSNQKYIK